MLKSLRDREKVGKTDKTAVSLSLSLNAMGGVRPQRFGGQGSRGQPFLCRTFKEQNTGVGSRAKGVGGTFRGQGATYNNKKRRHLRSSRRLAIQKAESIRLTIQKAETASPVLPRCCMFY